VVRKRELRMASAAAWKSGVMASFESSATEWTLDE
jgi:hypothetical protein